MNLKETEWQLSFAGVIVAAALGLLGCEEADTGTIDSSGNSPQVSDARVFPDTVNVDTLSATGGIYTITSMGSVKASDADGDLGAVLLRIIGQSSPIPFAETTLHDDGVSPDSAAGDGLFAGVFQFGITRAEAGPYRIQIVATDSKGQVSTALEPILHATRANSPPMLDTLSLIAPDTLVVPVGGSTILAMSIAAIDSDGLADIQSVFFLSPDGGSPDFRFPLLDDGGQSSGDLLAGDGTFSILLLISDSPTVRGTYRFIFHAEDSFADTSASFLHYITIQ